MENASIRIATQQILSQVFVSYVRLIIWSVLQEYVFMLIPTAKDQGLWVTVWNVLKDTI